MLLALTLLIDSSMVLRLRVTDDAGEPVADASITATLSRMATEIWRGALLANPALVGHYRVLLPHDLELTVGEELDALIVADSEGRRRTVRARVWVKA